MNKWWRKKRFKVTVWRIARVVFIFLVVSVAVYTYASWFDAILYRLGISDFELSLRSCTVYRLDEGSFPVMKLDMLATSGILSDRTIVLNSMSIPQYDIELVFDKGTSFEIAGHGSATPTKQLRSDTLDYFLKIPPSKVDFELVLNYSILGVKSDIERRFSDTTVRKATYWMTPVFDSPQEAVSFPRVTLLSALEAVEKRDRKPGDTPVPFQFYTSIEDKHCIRLSTLGLGQILDSTGLDMDAWGTFRKKYGGFYFGVLRQDQERIPYDLRPSSTLYGLNDYDELDILGLNLPDSFCLVEEFVHIVFEPGRLPDSLIARQENSEYCVHLMHGTYEGIAQVDSSLSTKGFITETQRTSFWDFLQHLLQMSSSDKQGELLNTLNDHIWGTMTVTGVGDTSSIWDTVRCSISDVVLENGVLVFCSEKTDGQVMLRILESIDEVYASRPFCVISLDCTPLNRLNEKAPFAEPVLVYLNYPPDAPCWIGGSFSISPGDRLGFRRDQIPCTHVKRWDYQGKKTDIP